MPVSRPVYGTPSDWYSQLGSHLYLFGVLPPSAAAVTWFNMRGRWQYEILMIIHHWETQLRRQGCWVSWALLCASQDWLYYSGIYSIPNECFKTVFANSVPQPQKSTFRLKYLSPFGSVNSHPPVDHFKLFLKKKVNFMFGTKLVQIGPKTTVARKPKTPTSGCFGDFWLKNVFLLLARDKKIKRVQVWTWRPHIVIMKVSDGEKRKKEQPGISRNCFIWKISP